MQLFKDNQSKNSILSDEAGIFVPHRHMSWLIAGLVMLSFFIFITGYFLGQKKVLEQFSDKLEQDSLSDKIYSSLYALYDSKGGSEAEITEGASEAEDVEDATKIAQTNTSQVEASSVEGVNVGLPSQKHYAQLVGFGSSEPAYAFASRLNKEKTMVEVKKHLSRSKKGKVRSWYQVVTKPFDTKEALVAFVDMVIQKEHLKDVRMVTS